MKQKGSKSKSGNRRGRNKVSPAPRKDKRPLEETQMADANFSVKSDSDSKGNSKGHEEACVPTASTTDDDEEASGLTGLDQNIYDGGNIFYASDSDPYIYSDDSESFSDAYFLPQREDFPHVLYPRGSTHSLTNLKDEHIGRRIAAVGTEEEEEPLTPFAPNGHVANDYQRQGPIQYGSVQPFSDRSMPPFKISGSIQEDFPVDDDQQPFLNSDQGRGMYYYNIPSNMPADEADARYLRQAKREWRRLKKQQKADDRRRQILMIQNQHKREQALREHTVSRVKGRPQDERKCRDPFFAYLFLAQLLIVLICAAKSGTLVVLSKQRSTWGRLQHVKTSGDVATGSIIPTATASTSSSTGNTIAMPTSSTSGLSSFSSPPSSLGHNNRRLARRWLQKRQENATKQSSSSPMLDSGTRLSQNDTVPDMMLHDNDTAKLLTDDMFGSDQSSSSSSEGNHKPESKGKSSPNQSTGSPVQSTSFWRHKSFTIDYRNAISVIGISGFYACILSYLSFGFMLIMSRALIQVTLVFSILLALAWGMLGLTINPYGIISIMGFGALLLTLGYTIFNWQRVPFASTNLHTALCAMRCTGDLTLLGMGAILVAFGWCVIWSMAFVGTVDTYDPGQCTNQQLCVFEVPLIRICMYGFFTISFYWTNTVIKNILRVTVASTIGTWWYYPDEISPLCSAAVGQPLIRSLTKSLGSICLGSLVSQAAQITFIVGQCFCYTFRSGCCRKNPIQGRETMAGDALKKDALTAATDVESNGISPPSSTEESVMISPEKETNRLFGRRIRCFNRWSYTYIGMYGYNFCEGPCFSCSLL